MYFSFGFLILLMCIGLACCYFNYVEESIGNSCCNCLESTIIRCGRCCIVEEKYQEHRNFVENVDQSHSYMKTNVNKCHSHVNNAFDRRFDNEESKLFSIIKIASLSISQQKNQILSYLFLQQISTLLH